MREFMVEDSTPYAIDLKWVTPQGEDTSSTVFAKNSSMCLANIPALRKHLHTEKSAMSSIVSVIPLLSHISNTEPNAVLT